MRIWDIPAERLCRVHLLGEHRELHAIWTILTQDKAGYRAHPETKRWEGRLRALYLRHDEEVAEISKRGYHHRSDLDESLASGSADQTVLIDTITRQYELLAAKGCLCTKKARS